MKRLIALLASALVLSMLDAGRAYAADAAADYPNKAIRFVVAYPPGGAGDLVTRLFGQYASARLGQLVVVENRAGAGTNIGASFVAKSPADGYTLFMATSPTLAVNPHLYKPLPYDPQKDFTPVILLTTVPSLVLVHPSVPVKSMKELTEYLKSRPGQVNYASAGNGTPAHLGAELYKKLAGIQMNHIPYKGGPAAQIDLVAGRTTMMIALLPETLPMVKDGRLKALAITTAQRSPLVPDLPTVAESGLPGYEMIGWFTFVAPAGTPKEIVAKLNKTFNEALQDRTIRDKLSGMGFEIGGGTPEHLAGLISSESKKWGQVVAEANIKVD